MLMIIFENLKDTLLVQNGQYTDEIQQSCP